MGVDCREVVGSCRVLHAPEERIHSYCKNHHPLKSPKHFSLVRLSLIEALAASWFFPTSIFGFARTLAACLALSSTQIRQKPPRTAHEQHPKTQKIAPAAAGAYLRVGVYASRLVANQNA
jgi:hypothetical protein